MEQSLSTTGQRIRLLRYKRKLSQKELAKRMGLSDKTICAYETGQVTPAPDRLIQLADILGTTTDYLLCRTHNPLDRVLILPSTMSEQQLTALRSFIQATYEPK